MSMRGIWKIHNAMNTYHARNHYAELCAFAVECGRADLVNPKPFTESGWGWRRLDKLSEKMRSKLGADYETAPQWGKSVGVRFEGC